MAYFRNALGNHPVMEHLVAPTAAASHRSESSEDIVIRAVGLSKCYHIYDRSEDRLKQAVFPRLHTLAHPFSERQPPRYYREFWALKDVSFEVKRSESVGIIGRNGAGKSTLLQLIAGTLTATSGTIEVSGRVAALLELGSGFNPEFTGRENIYLNASLLGLSTEETAAKFEEIEAFADIGDFIEQPVKNYSSGMLMRVAFAVQTAVNPAILIVDEALSVGDMFFQAKCMARLNALKERGVTLLLVSHDIGTIRQVCDKAILLDHGALISCEAAGDVADRYMRMQFEERNRSSRGTGALPRQTQNAKIERYRATGSSEAEVVDKEGQQPASQTGLGTQKAGLHDEPQPISPNSERIAEAPSKLMFGHEAFRERARFQRAGNGHARYINVLMLKNGVPSDTFEFGDTVTLRQVVYFYNTLSNLNVSYKIRTLQGVDVVFGDTRLEAKISNTYERHRLYTFDWEFQMNLMHGRYTIMSGLNHPPSLPGTGWVYVDVVPICYQFTILPRAAGMVDGLVVWQTMLSISSTSAGAELSEEVHTHV